MSVHCSAIRLGICLLFQKSVMKSEHLTENSSLRIHDYIHAAGKKLCGEHRRIFLSDPRRRAAEKLKTIIRQTIA